VILQKGPNIATLPDFDSLPHELESPVLLKLGDDISTDEIMPAGSRVLPYRSNIPKISRFVFEAISTDYVKRARNSSSHAVVGGHNYGQGSSREHAALAPRFLGLRLVLAKSYARIHWQNLINFGVLPLKFVDESDYEEVRQGDRLKVHGLGDLSEDGSLKVENLNRKIIIEVSHDLSNRQIQILQSGSLINWVRIQPKRKH
jgi:aconitate hydratase